jgi:hypothetical protein
MCGDLCYSKQERDWMYAEFAEMQCPTLQSVEEGQLVLGHKDKSYFRGKVLATRDSKARVLNLDIGSVVVCTNIRYRPIIIPIIIIIYITYYFYY